MPTVEDQNMVFAGNKSLHMLKLVLKFSFVFLAVGCSKSENVLLEQSYPCVEQTDTDCFCTTHFDPVCGCNNKTYSNACDAFCHGIDVLYDGSCKN